MCFIKTISTYPQNAKNAATWVLFMTFFTYSKLYEAVVSSGVSFVDSFVSNQAGFLSMFVNLGLVIMLAFDYSNVSKPIDYRDFRTPFVLIVLVLAIMWHTSLEPNGYDNFVAPLSWKVFSYLLHLIFIVGLWWMKFRVLNASEPELIVKGIVKPKE